MKIPLCLLLLGQLFTANAAPIDDAKGLLQSKKFGEAAAAFGAVPPETGEKGEAAYLQGLSLLLAEKPTEAMIAADKVPAESNWGAKAKFLKAASLTKSKKFREAEAIYSAEADRVFSPQRRDALVKGLLEFAEEMANPVTAGELNPAKPDWAKAAGLCDKVLDMPIGEDLRAAVLFKKAGLLQKSGDLNAAHAAFNAWLLLFDPTWKSAFDERKQDQKEEKPMRAERFAARLRLAECLLALGRTGDARLAAKELRNLLGSLPEGSVEKKEFTGDAAWIYVKTFALQPALPQVQRQQMLQNGVQQAAEPSANGSGNQGETGPIGSPFQQFANAVAFPNRAAPPVYLAADYLTELRAFLKNHSAHWAAAQASEAIAATLDREGKDAEAMAAWTEFIEKKNFSFTPENQLGGDGMKVDPATGLTPSEALVRRQQAAAFRLGQIHFEHRRYTEAIAQWQKYITQHPNGKEWQQAQSRMVDAEFQSGLTAVAAEDEKKARELFDRFLSKYPLDSRARQILFIYGQFRYAAGISLKEQNAPADKLRVEFGTAITEWARLIGKYPNTEESSLALYNTGLILSDELGRLEDALAVFKQVTWGNWAGPARQRVELMSSKSLAVASERVFRLHEVPKVKVSLRNIDNLKVSRYPLDVEAFFRSRHRMDAIDQLDIDLIAPDKTWEVPVKDFARHRSIQQEIPVELPAGKPGAYVIRVEADDWQATTLLVRSDVDVLVETARREVLAYVMSGPDKKPMAKASVLLSDGEKIIATGTTGEDGVFRAKPEGIDKLSSVRVFVSAPQGMAGSFLETAGLAVSVAPEKMSRIFFNQSKYRPREIVRWQALRREVRDGAFPVPAPGEGWKWRAQLPDGRLMYEGAITWDGLGVCGGSFALPPSAFAGDYKVRVFNEKESLQANFSVVESEAEAALQVRYKLERADYLAGESVKCRFTLAWGNGLPASGEKATVYYPDKHSEERTTDAQGSILVECVAPASGSWAFRLAPHNPLFLAGESESDASGIEARFMVAATEFSAAFGKLPDLVLAGEAFDLMAQATRFDGKPHVGALQLKVLRRDAAKPSRVLEGVPWISGFSNQPVDSLVSEVEIKTGDKGQSVQSVTLPQPGSYVIRLLGKDRQGNEVSAESTLRAAGGANEAQLRLLASDAPLIAGQTLKFRVQAGAAHPSALITVHAQEFFSHQIVPLQAGANTLEIPVSASQAPNFRVTVATMDGRNVHVASRPFEVRSGLKVTLAAEGNGCRVQTADLAGNPVAARVILATYSAASGAVHRPDDRVVIPTRATGLSLESSAAFFHTGASRRKQGDQFQVVINEQMMLCDIQKSEINLNLGNSVLIANNGTLMGDNFFLSREAAQKHGVFVINPGLSDMKRDALGTGVKISTPGVPDVRWAERESMTAWPENSADSPFSSAVVQTDATGMKKLEQLVGAEGKAIVAYAVAENSLVAGDVLFLPGSEKLVVRAIWPEVFHPGNEFAFPIILTNRGAEARPEAIMSFRLAEGDLAATTAVPRLEAGDTCVVWMRSVFKATDAEGNASTDGAREWPYELAVQDVKQSGILRGWTSDAGKPTHVLSVASEAGLFAPGEHILTLPGDETITQDADGKPLPAAKVKKAIGFRLIKASDLASFPGASLNDSGELIDASEPQNAASELLHVLAAWAGVKEETKTTLRSRLEILTAELAVTESEGGWAWENLGISPGLLTTAFTWRTLLEARSAGVVVSDMLLKRTAAFVGGRYSGIGATDFERKATTLQALAAAGQADFSLLNPLFRSRETLTPVALSRLCAAFIHAGREEEAKAVLAQLMKTGTSGKTAAGEETLFWPGSNGVAGLNAPEESTAAALWCLARLAPDSPEARRIALWLLNSPACAPGGATRCRGQVMQALAAWARNLPRAAAEDTVTALSDGKEVGPTGRIWPMPKDGKLTIRVKGRTPAVVVAAIVREALPEDPKTWEFPKVAGRTYFHDNYAEAERRLTVASTSPVSQAAYGQLIHITVKIGNHPDPTWRAHGNFLQVDEEIPAGCLLVEGSLRHNADKVERNGNFLRFRYGPGTMEDISYQVVALRPGTWTAQAAVLADPYDPSRCRRGTASTVTIHPPGTPSPDAYQMNRVEHLELARLLFAQGKGAECLAHLDAVVAVGKVSQEEERDIARMKLWILAEKPDGDAKVLIDAFELLTERHPQLVIPFEKLLRVGAAYRKLNEFERAGAIFRAALDGAFLQDSSLSAAIEDAGDYLGGVDLQERLWLEFPDSKDVRESLSGLAQSLSTKAPEAERLPVRRGKAKLGKYALLNRSRDLLQRYTTHFPTDEQADDAAFSLVNVFFALKDYPGVVSTAAAGAERHTTGAFADSFKYMAALGYFWQGAFDKALSAAAPVANGESKDRDYARYVTAQVLHAQGKPAEAIQWYQKVKGAYEDAAEAIAWFEEKQVSLPEVSIFKPGEPVKVTLDYRNIQEGAVQLYKVDLMKLYLREKSLSNITRVNLAGIAPQAGETFQLGEGRDYAVKKKDLVLPVREEGAYLAIVRGDSLFTSGLVLISPLKLEVKENRAGSVRVHVSDAATGKALADAEVKALGSASQQVQSGATDPRGVFEAGSIAGTSTVIVKQGENRYAFHRGTLSMGVQTEFEPPQLPQGTSNQSAFPVTPATPLQMEAKPKVMSKGDYLKNVDESNKVLQQQQIEKWDAKRRSNAKGVEASEALKK